MENLVRNVKDIDSDDRRALEHVIGQRLRDNQQLVIRVVNVEVKKCIDKNTPPDQDPGASLPAWCNVYEGLSDEDLADLERTILTRADLARSSE